MPAPAQSFASTSHHDSFAGTRSNASPGPLNRRFGRCQAALPNDGPIAADPASVALIAMAERAALSSATILITGPSGSGKEVMARHIHACSQRRARPFVAINCAALPEAMLEALLFGHERGAFTGAQGASPGLFRAAEGGTLFLDELGELSLPLQAKLLRAVESREVLPLGALAPVSFDVRLLAATNRDLAADVEDGRFRADLYWRLAVFPLALPPLAARPLDIVPLAASLLRRAGHPDVSICEEALARLQAHNWPGNVRELGNLLERALILSGGGPVDCGHLRFDGNPPPARPSLADCARRSEADAIQMALAETGGRKADAARRLGISERALRYKLAAIAGRPRRSGPLQERVLQ